MPQTRRANDGTGSRTQTSPSRRSRPACAVDAGSLLRRGGGLADPRRQASWVPLLGLLLVCSCFACRCRHHAHDRAYPSDDGRCAMRQERLWLLRGRLVRPGVVVQHATGEEQRPAAAAPERGAMRIAVYGAGGVGGYFGAGWPRPAPTSTSSAAAPTCRPCATTACGCVASNGTSQCGFRLATTRPRSARDTCCSASRRSTPNRPALAASRGGH